MALVSLVLISYNDESNVDNAIRSLRNQSLKDIEIVCVDDGSSDRTLEIMKQAASEDSRVTVFTQKHNGCFSARYKGLQEVTSDYVMFIDSDDVLLPEAADTLMNEVKIYHADVLEFGVNLVAEDLTNHHVRNVFNLLSEHFSHNKPVPLERSGGALINACFCDKSITWNIWNKIYKTSIVREAWKFYQGEFITMLEDMLETLMILLMTKCYVRIDAKLYSYHVGHGITTSPNVMSVSEASKLFGMQALILKLQNEWMDKLVIKPQNCEIGITAFRRMVRNCLFNSLFFKCDPAKRNEIIAWIGNCISTDDAYRELLTYAFENYAPQVSSLQKKLAQVMINN